MLSFRGGKLFSAFILAALLGTLLFAAPFAATKPADAAILGNPPNSPRTLVPAGGSVVVNMGSYIRETDSALTLRCPDITVGSSSKIQSVTRSGCTYTVAAKATSTSGNEAVSMRFESYTSSNTLDTSRTLTWRMDFGPASNITFTAPTGLTVGTNRTLTIDALDYATEADNRYTISCGTATNVSIRLTSVTRLTSGNGCMYTIVPGVQGGSASFQVPYTSSAGATRTGTISLTVGPASTITFNAPSGLTVGTNRTQTIDAAAYVSDGNYAISCGDATSIDATELNTVTRSSSGNGCMFTITPKNVQGAASFAVPYTSAGGHTLSGTIPITVGPASTITYQAPSGLSVASNLTLTVDAATYASDGTYTITCGDATNIDTVELNTVVRGSDANACMFTITPKAVLGAASFTVPYTSSGGHTQDGIVSLQVGPASAISFSAPAANSVAQAGTSITIDLGPYASDGSYTVSCGTVTTSSSLITISSQNNCSVVLAAGATSGTAEISVPYSSTGGATSTETVSVDVIPASNITFSAPTGLIVGSNRSLVINAATYATETHSSYTITCADAANIDTTEIQSVTRDGCTFTVETQGVQGTASFDVPYSSSGGDTETGTISLTVGPASNIVYQAPSDLSVAANLTLTIDASSYASDGTYTITCGDATNIDTARLAAVVRDTSGSGCSYTITPVSTIITTAHLGTGSFTVPYRSSGGHAQNGVVNVVVRADSEIVFTAPASNPLVAVNGQITIDLSDFVSDGSYTVSCGNTPSPGSGVSFGQVGCRLLVTAGANTGNIEISVPYTSSGGASATHIITVEVIPASDITFNAPSGLQVGINRTQTIDASEYVTEAHSSYTITCGDATSIDTTKLVSVVRDTAGSGCVFTINPISTLATSAQGAATFSVPYTSSGGDTETGTISIDVGPASTIIFNDRDLWVATSSTTYQVSANIFVTDLGGYTITCGAVTVFDSDEISGVTQPSAGSCRYTVALTGTAGPTSFQIPYTSSGGHFLTATLTLRIAVSSITFTAPAVTPAVAASGMVVIDAAPFARDGGFSITCGTATSVSSSISSIARANNCEYTVTAGSTADATASFTVPYTSSGGATANGAITVNIGQTSSVSYTAPSGLKVAVGATKTFDLSSAATDGGYGITCGAASSVGSLFTGVANTGCSFAVTAGSTQGTATFSVLFTSAGGDTETGVVSVEVGAASTLAFSPPSGLRIGSQNTKRFDFSSYATDGDYKVECGDAQSISNTAFASVTRPYSGLDGTYDPLSCVFEVTARDTRGAGTFVVPVKSEATGTGITGTVTITVGAASDIAVSGVPAPHPPTLPAAMPPIVPLSRGDCQVYTFGITTDLSDCYALVALQNHWATEENRNLPMDHPLRTWGTSSRLINRWQGVRLGGSTGSPLPPGSPSQGRVIELDLSSLGIRGTLPDWFGAGPRSGAGSSFDQLKVLNLQGNYLTGELPAAMNSLSRSAGITSRTGSLLRFSFCLNYFRGNRPSILLDTNPATAVETPLFTPDGVELASGDIPCQLAGSPPAALARSSAWTYARVGTGSEKRVTAWVEGLGLAGDYYALNPIQYWDQDGTGWEDTTEYTCLARSSVDGACTRSRETALAAGSTIRWRNGYYDTATLSALNLTNVSLTAPVAIQQGATFRFDASRYATDGNYAISCSEDYVEDDFAFSSVTQSGTGNCVFELEVDAAADVTQEPFYAYLDIGYISQGGQTRNASFNFFIIETSNIVYTPAEDLPTENALVVTLDASVYSPFGASTSSCSDPMGVDADRITVARTGCSFTATATAGATPAVSTSFRVYYTSVDGRNGLKEFTFSIATSAMTLTSPAGLTLAAGQSIHIDASKYATDSRYAITCGQASGVDASKLSVSKPDASNSCAYRIAASASAAAGATTFTVAYSSSGGDTHQGTVTVNIGRASDISFNAPDTLTRGVTVSGRSDAANRIILIDLTRYATDGSYTIGCAGAKNIDPRFSGVQVGRNCVARIFLDATIGTMSFTVAYVSTGGDTHDGVIQVGTNSALAQIIFTDPGTLTVGRNQIMVINALDHASETNNYLIQCEGPTEVDATKMAVTRNGCSFTIDPVDTLSTGNQGSTTFKMTYTVGATETEATYTINIGPDSTITYVAPTGLQRAVNFRSYTIDAAPFASDGSYAISCGDATDIDTAEISSITRADGTCEYTIALTGTQGPASFVVPYTSTGGDTLSRTVRFIAGPPSAIIFTAPQSGIAIGSSQTRTIDASDYASDGSYTIGCGTITTTDTIITLGAQNDCEIPITSGTTAGTAEISVPYTSTGGATLTRTISITAAAPSNIVFSAPTGLKVAINRTLVIDASLYATDGGYAITCAAATSIDNDKLASVARNGCSYTVTPVSTLTSAQQGTATFTVPYTSAGSDTENGVFSIRVGPASTITFTPPTSPVQVAKNQVVTFDASSYATEASPIDYAITCGDATSIDTTELQAVTRNGCSFTIYPKNMEGAASFTVPYRSEGGHSVDGAIPVTVGPDSTIVFTPPTSLTVRAGGTLRINALGYITESSAYTVTCGAATRSNTAIIASATRNGCDYTIRAGRTLGAATLTVPYASTGGDTENGVITITVTQSTETERTERPTTQQPPSSAPSSPAGGSSSTPDPGSEAEDLSQAVWGTYTAQNPTTAAAIRVSLDLSARRAIYTWNSEAQAWSQVTNPDQNIPAGTTVSFRTTEPLTAEQQQAANLGQDTQQATLASRWNLINPPRTERDPDSSGQYLIHSDLSDCDQLLGIIAIATYNSDTRRWSLMLPCHPQAQTRLTTGENPPFAPLTITSPTHITYIYARTQTPIEITWNAETQTYQPAS